jgi:hypothetical protein
VVEHAGADARLLGDHPHRRAVEAPATITAAAARQICSRLIGPIPSFGIRPPA